MPNRKKFNARFPPARIKKIMRTDKEVGKVAAPVPAVISRALELFAEQLLQKAGDVTLSRGSRTLSPAHLKQCIQSERRFDFLRELVENVTDAAEPEEGGSGVPPPAAAAASSRAAPTPPPSQQPPPAAHQTTKAAAGTARPADTARPVGRPSKYLKMEIPSPVAVSANGQPHSAPAGRPPVPDLIHTSLLGLTGGAVTASPAGAAPPFPFAAVSPALFAAGGVFGAPQPPPPAHRGPARPALAVRYGSMPETERPDGL